ncbi:MAG: NAD(P)H-dependent oxidoreductase subunit E [Candidatus Krumholzibacteriota bacterium]|nr:NAD(P)H-dependent oxidoreductase subunit E [Candidatus Krumholzibacteriota bacterium]
MESATPSTFEYTSENETKFQNLLTKYPTKQAVVLPALWLALDQNGYLTPEAMDYVARRLEQSPVSVYAVVEFYTMFHTSPTGTHHVQLCRTLSCVMRGSDDLHEMIAGELGIKPGGRTQDEMFSFETVECLGSCGGAPMMRMDNHYFENLTRERLGRIIQACRDGRDPREEDHA